MAITSGSYTIGVGLDYDDLHDFADDFGTQTGDITGTISADEDVCDSLDADFDHDPNGHTYTITVASSNRFTASTTWPANIEGVSDYARFVGGGANEIYFANEGGILESLYMKASKIRDNGGTIVRNCVIHDASALHGIQRTPTANGVSYYHNLMMWNCRYGIWCQGPDGLFQCSYISMIPGLDAGIHTEAANTECNGCAILGSGNCWSVGGAGTFTGGSNLSTQTPDSVMPDDDTNGAVGITNSNYFEDVTAGNEDLHKLAAADGTYDGGPSTGLGTGWPGGDIDGSTARSDWDIGADEQSTVDAPVAGTSSITFAATAESFIAEVFAAGTSSLTFGADAQSRVDAFVAGASSIAFGADAQSTVAVPVAGTSSLTFGVAGAVDIVSAGAVNMAGTSSLTFGVTGAATVSGSAQIHVAGTSSVAFGTAAQSRVDVFVAAASSITFGVVAQALLAKVWAAGATSLTFTVVGAASVPGTEVALGAIRLNVSSADPVLRVSSADPILRIHVEEALS